MVKKESASARFPVLRDIARLAKKGGVHPIDIASCFITRGKRTLPGCKIQGTIGLVYSLHTFRYADPKAPTTRKIVRATIVPFRDLDANPGMLVFEINIKNAACTFKDLFFIPQKVYFKTYLSGAGYIPIEPAKRNYTRHPGAIAWEQWRGVNGLRRCLAQLQSAAS